jgi:glyoxylase-like metal-dependent hydrolase (beta-lactamase superfamily II)
VCFDASRANTGGAVVAALREWRTDRIDTLVYTHGHVDHVGGSGAMVADASNRGHRQPRVVAHEAVAARFERYRRTNDWNVGINARQFGGVRAAGLGLVTGDDDRFLPRDVAEPDVAFARATTLRVGDTTMELHHARGETDDHTWTWWPEQRVVFCGDLFIWMFPNAGNPQKVQRHAGEWAAALRSMAALRPALLCPAHGLPIEGEARVATALDNTATALEHLVDSTVALMNQGADLDTIIHTERVPDTLADLPYLLPLYDEPEFVVRNVWRLYGGWWDGDPSTLKPAPRRQLATELAALAGGAVDLAARALVLADEGDLPLACHLAEIAADAAPDDRGVHEARQEVYRRRRAEATSLMAKGIYAGAMRESAAVLDPD